MKGKKRVREEGDEEAYEEIGVGAVGRRVEVGAAEMVRCMLQFLEERGYRGTAKKLREESGVRETGVMDREKVQRAVKDGKWAEVLEVMSRVEAPQSTCAAVHEAAAADAYLRDGPELARQVLEASEAWRRVRVEDPGRWRGAVEKWGRDGGDAKEAKTLRETAADSLEALPTCAPGRFEVLVGQAARWRHHLGELSARRFSPYTEDTAQKKKKKKSERAISKPAGAIRFGAGCRPTAALFLAGGEGLVTGSSDGLVEVYELATCRLMDLDYQTRDELMAHDGPISALAQSLDAELLLSADNTSVVKAWRVQTGHCLRKWTLQAPVVSLAVGPDRVVAAGAVDGVVKLLGLASGAQLAVFRQDAPVHCLKFTTPHGLISSDSNGSLYLWDPKNSARPRVKSVPDYGSDRGSRPILALLDPPRDTDDSVSHDLLAVSATGKAFFLAAFFANASRVVKTLSSPSLASAGFAAAAASPTSAFLYCLTQDSRLLSFDLKAPPPHDTQAAVLDLQPCGGGLDAASKKPSSRRHVTGLAAHPLRSLVATFGDDDVLRLWK